MLKVMKYMVVGMVMRMRPVVGVQDDLLNLDVIRMILIVLA